MTKRKTQPATTVPTERFCVYLGPTVLGTIQFGTVYQGTREEVNAQLAGVIAKYPLAAELIVEDAALPEARVAVKKSGTLLNNYYRRFLREYK